MRRGTSTTQQQVGFLEFSMKGKKLSYSLCNQAVSAIVDLWSYQRSANSNSFETPRSKAIAMVLRGVRQRKAKNNRQSNIDSAFNSLTNGYITKGKSGIDLNGTVQQYW